MQILLPLALLILLAVCGFLFIVYRKLQTLQQPQAGEQNMFMLLQQQLQEMTKTVDQKMGETYRSMGENQHRLQQTIQDQFAHNAQIMQGITGSSTKMIAEITEKLTSLDKTNQQVITFSQQLTNLEKVLTNQKQRGNLGEAGLRLVLENILPPTAFALQYQFDDGDIVDAVIFAKEGMIPVDAKFSLDNYTRLINESDPEKRAQLESEFKNDLKKRIDETGKYIKPMAGTMEFAFMFIPAEAIYYDLLVNEVGAVKVNTRNLIDYAFNEKKVIIVSPTTFAAYLQTVLQGLRAFQIEEGAKVIRKNVEMLTKHLKAYDDFMKRLGVSLGTTVNHFNTAYKEFGKIDKDIVKITEGERQIEPLSIDRPQADDTDAD
ncbi:MAG: hypothetical protein A3J66_00080 [Candidatus Magasanikbacteria bacterium RIFCSPHIGHO2_02_FULL_47_14]|uniref:DNA recombination protein RmuC n=1 Tax=Candidatus Magasanikbacteria bacterium RIFCSPHIGHO2_02_FULL_47_14 TaxID=1798680 RepID=A0A1F6LYU8_9BACT|nr:MAG: hypothetical protein A3J66_00080 [Candidatus Magasanikbacteria bacterium RIFCSPHIGHO2_02_FULL_47_14]